MNENSDPCGSGGRFGGGTIILNPPSIVDEIVMERRVDDETFENRQLLKHDEWFERFVPQLVEDARLRRVISPGGRPVDAPVVVPHHRPGIKVDPWTIPADGGPVWRTHGACFRCLDGRFVAEHPEDGSALPVEPLFLLWVKGNARTIVEIGLCRICVMELVEIERLAPNFKQWPDAAV